MEPLFPYPRLLQMRVPSYELPENRAEIDGVRLLQFGSPAVAVQQFQPEPPSTLLTVASSPRLLPAYTDSHCQVDLPTDPVVSYLSQDVQASVEVPKQFEDVRDIHESDYKQPVSFTQQVNLISGILIMPPPTQKFTGTVETAEGLYSHLPPRPVPPEVLQSRLEGKRMKEYEHLRLKFEQSGAKPAPKPTYEEIMQNTTEEVTANLKLIAELQRELEAKDKEMEEMQNIIDREERDKAALLAIGRIKEAEDWIKALEDESLGDEERTALILARNKELYAEIDSALERNRSFSPAPVTAVAENTVKMPSKGVKNTKKKGGLRPQVIKRPDGYRNPTLTKRISSAFGTAERAIKVAGSTRKLVPAVISVKK